MSCVSTHPYNEFSFLTEAEVLAGGWVLYVDLAAVTSRCEL